MLASKKIARTNSFRPNWRVAFSSLIAERMLTSVSLFQMLKELSGFCETIAHSWGKSFDFNDFNNFSYQLNSWLCYSWPKTFFWLRLTSKLDYLIKIISKPRSKYLLCVLGMNAQFFDKNIGFMQVVMISSQWNFVKGSDRFRSFSNF
jgi:hypothetical protein